jgi:hypothetical protein
MLSLGPGSPVEPSIADELSEGHSRRRLIRDAWNALILPEVLEPVRR